jgi:polysaccharide deacetylase family protein (PEP-CTERM system associated)
VVKHIFTVDLEDWFHTTVKGAPPESEWDRLGSRIEGQTLELLDLLDRYDVRATFFVLGWVGEKHPELVREVSARGHEIAIHGYSHRLLSSFTPETFARDVDLAVRAVESAGVNTPVLGFRAPSYSLTPETSWAWEVLADKGFRYDASVFPQWRHDGGWPGAPSRPYKPLEGRVFWEIPISVGKIGPFKTVFSAGGYFRLIPGKVILTNLERLNHMGVPAVFMVHPKDVYPGAPATSRNLYTILRQKLHTGSTFEKLKRVLTNFDFTTMLDIVEELERQS